MFALRVVLAVLVALWAFSSLWAGAVAVVAESTPHQALAMVPNQPQALATLLTANREDPSAPLEQDGASLLRAAPLSDLPMALAGEAALAAGRLEEAAVLLDAALARNPRREATRVWRAATAVGQGQTTEALAQLARLVILDGERRPVYLDAIAALSETPEGRAWLLSPAFAGDPAAPIILRRLNDGHSDLSLLLTLNQSDPSAQAGLVERALRERGPSVAFILWLSLLPEDMSAAFSWPFNGRFEELAAPPPFNWRIHSRSVGLQEGGGLRVSYTGRSRQSLVSQMMLLRPGRYQFTSELSGDGQERGGALVWEISCVDGGDVLGRTPRGGSQGGGRRVEVTFAIPAAGCDGQRLTLIGAPGEFPMRARASITAVAITGVTP